MANPNFAVCLYFAVTIDAKAHGKGFFYLFFLLIVFLLYYCCGLFITISFGCRAGNHATDHMEYGSPWFAVAGVMRLPPLGAGQRGRSTGWTFFQRV